MCGWRPGSRSAWGRVQAEPEHSGAKAVGAFAPGLKTYVPIGEENLFHPRPALASGARTPGCCGVVLVLLGRLLRDVGTTLGPDRNLPHAASLARFRRVCLS